MSDNEFKRPSGMEDRVFAVMKSSPMMKEVRSCTEKSDITSACYTHNRKFAKKHINLLAGDFFVSCDDVAVSTVLGSCITVCLYSLSSSYCGMNHFMLPQIGEHYKNEKNIMRTDAAFYGINSMEMMMNALYKTGVRKEQLKAKVFGGGNVLKFDRTDDTVGEKNIDFVFKFLEAEKIPVTACSVGGDYARKVIFFYKTKEVLMSRISKTRESEIIREEEFLRHQSKKTNISMFAD